MTNLDRYESNQSDYTICVFWFALNAVAFLGGAFSTHRGFWDVAVCLWCGTVAAGFLGAALYYRSECRRMERDFRRFGAFWCILPEIDQ